jgi:hypothetical protein
MYNTDYVIGRTLYELLLILDPNHPLANYKVIEIVPTDKLSQSQNALSDVILYLKGGKNNKDHIHIILEFESTKIKKIDLAKYVNHIAALEKHWNYGDKKNKIKTDMTKIYLFILFSNNIEHCNFNFNECILNINRINLLFSNRFNRNDLCDSVKEALENDKVLLNFDELFYLIFLPLCGKFPEKIYGDKKWDSKMFDEFFDLFLNTKTLDNNQRMFYYEAVSILYWNLFDDIQRQKFMEGNMVKGIISLAREEARKEARKEAMAEIHKDFVQRLLADKLTDDKIKQYTGLSDASLKKIKCEILKK